MSSIAAAAPSPDKPQAQEGADAEQDVSSHEQENKAPELVELEQQLEKEKEHENQEQEAAEDADDEEEEDQGADDEEDEDEDEDEDEEEEEEEQQAAVQDERESQGAAKRRQNVRGEKRREASFVPAAVGPQGVAVRKDGAVLQQDQQAKQGSDEEERRQWRPSHHNRVNKNGVDRGKVAAAVDEDEDEEDRVGKGVGKDVAQLSLLPLREEMAIMDYLADRVSRLCIESLASRTLNLKRRDHLWDLRQARYRRLSTARRIERDVELSRKRALRYGNIAGQGDEDEERGAEGWAAKELPAGVQERLQRLPEFIAGIDSNDPAAQLEGTLAVRKLLSIERGPPIDQVIRTGVVPRLVQFMLHDVESPALAFEAAWAVTNVASGTSEHTRIVINAGGVEAFVHLLDSPNDDCKEQAVWGLGNISGDSPAARDLVLASGVMAPILRCLQDGHKVSMLRNATWCLSNLCRGKPQPPFETVSQALPTLAHLIYLADEEVLTDALWALSYLSDGENNRIQAVIEAGVCRRVVDCLLHQSPSVVTPALRTVGNIVTGDDVQTQAMLNCGCLASMVVLLQHPRKGIRKEAAWTVSNITAGNQQQIEAVMQAGLMPPLIAMLQNAEFDVKKEAAWAVSNATSGGSAEQLNRLLDMGCLPSLCATMDVPDARIAMVCLEAIENLLRVNPARVKPIIQACGAIDKLENMVADGAEEIAARANKLLDSIRN